MICPFIGYVLQVAEGFDVLSKINEAYCDKDGRPFQDIRIYHTVILDDPLPDPDGTVYIPLVDHRDSCHYQRL